MNSSDLSWRDLRDLIDRTAKSFAWKLVLLSLVFSIFTLIIQLQFSVKHNEITLEILNAKLDITFSAAGKSIDTELRSVMWNAEGDSCSFITESHGFVFLKMDESCSPEAKIINAMKAGLDGVLFYVPEGKSLALDRHYDIHILEIDLDLSTVIDRTPFRSAPKWMKESLLSTLISELISNLILSFVSGFIVFVLGWVGMISHNYKEYRQLRTTDALIRWCLLLLDIEFRSYAPRLYSVPFPAFKISKGDLEDFSTPKVDIEQGRTDRICFNDCCSICLDDFEENDLVRSLPCKHVFHSKCIDPWFLNHKRLCPVCKSDVVGSSMRQKLLTENVSHDCKA